MASPPVTLRDVARRLREAGILQSLQGRGEVVVSGVCHDSRELRPGDLFLAWEGQVHDAHAFLAQVAGAGAAGAVVERPDPALPLPQLQVRPGDGRLGAALAADEVLGSPWKSLFLAAVTGTNGKTTTALLARHLLQELGPARAVGTLGLVEESGEVRPGTEGLTTPGPVRITGWIREMVEAGVRYGILEASSHALDQHRLDGLRFDAAVFTNLGRDHLDYHRDPGAYRRSKARLLELLKPEGWAVVNGDDPAWEGLPFPGDRTLRVAVDGKGDLQAREVELLPGGSRFLLAGRGGEEEVRLPLPGRFNVENALAAAGVARAAGLPLGSIAAGLSGAPQIPGRLEIVVPEPYQVLIDFAHTPDALETVLSTLRPLVRGRLLVLFGAGGDRDRGKRPRMGAVVARWADLAFVTSDNPRTEDPEAIMGEVVAGMGEAPFRRIADRREAIREALAAARPGDLLLLAGKGHERYQTVGRERRSFDERVVVRELLEEGAGGRRP